MFAQDGVMRGEEGGGEFVFLALTLKWSCQNWVITSRSWAGAWTARIRAAAITSWPGRMRSAKSMP